jgi:16S rRNA (guanine(966)-N(2))-methyltransferase RsmD
LRIIAGDLKGRRLKTPSWTGLRPTSDQLRETLFNIAGQRLDRERVLDVFAGTGAIGIEGLSRGAGFAVFVEQDRRATALIEANAAACGVRDRCAIIRDTAAEALRKPIDGGPFDLIVLDPPYEFEPLSAILTAAATQLAPAGRLVLEHARRRAVPEAAGVRAVRTVLAGDSALTFFEAA